MFEQLLEILAEVNVWVLYGVAGFFTLLESTIMVGVLVPGDTILLLAGSTVTTPAAFATLFGLSVVGSVAGEALGYLIGRTWGPRLRASRLGRRLGEDRWAQAEAYLAGRGGKAVFAARFVAFIHALVPVTAGTVRMPFRRFISWCTAGALLWSALYVTTGTLAGASWRNLEGTLGLSSYVLAGIVGLVVLAVWAVRRRRAASRPTRASRSCVPTTVIPSTDAVIPSTDRSPSGG